jgi:hypothetical protein
MSRTRSPGCSRGERRASIESGIGIIQPAFQMAVTASRPSRPFQSLLPSDVRTDSTPLRHRLPRAVRAEWVTNHRFRLAITRRTLATPCPSSILSPSAIHVSGPTVCQEMELTLQELPSAGQATKSLRSLCREWSQPCGCER